MDYSSSLTDKEWECLEPLLLEVLPSKKQTRPSNWTKREILDGVLYPLKNGCNWGDLPKDLPPIQPSIGTTNNGVRQVRLRN
jgi:transposase